MLNILAYTKKNDSCCTYFRFQFCGKTKVGPADPISPDDKDEYFPYPNAPPFPKFPLAVPLHDGIHFLAR